jgi:hypothetical protein
MQRTKGRAALERTAEGGYIFSQLEFLNHVGPSFPKLSNDLSLPAVLQYLVPVRPGAFL